jgi:uncharacterized 2Fe-2S/4Fe-4S cluster protein (DUF4445 family)
VPKLTFLPEGAEIEARTGETVLSAARRAGVPLLAPCGGRGSCGRCAVKVEGPAELPTGLEIERLGRRATECGRRLACELRATGDLVVRIPPESRSSFAEILADGECVAFELSPSVEARTVGLRPPALDDNAADLTRLAEALCLDGIEAEIDAARALPSALRGSGFDVDVLLRGRRLTGVYACGKAPRPLGAAFDVGTTTVAASLVDLTTGAFLRQGSRTNPQHAFGDDVISRMDHAARGDKELAELRGAIVECLNDLLEELGSEAGASARDVHDVIATGNSTMVHLLLGLPPAAMATVPFVPVTVGPVECSVRDVGLTAAPGARVWTAPSASAYVGGDVVCGMLAVGFGGLKEDTVFIDMGTNGEVVAGTGERAISAATAAGPAFEGARISCGMRAVPGAIAHARLADGELSLDVLGGGEPRGVCGTGLVDLVAGLVEAGLVDETGRLADEAAGSLADRLREGPEGPEFVICAAREGGREVVLTQRDVRELQLAKGALAAGAGLLLQRLGIGPADVGRVLLAGAFGSTIDPANAVALGLLPTGIDPACVRAVGNTAAAGARAALVSTRAREEAVRLARWVEPVELSAEPGFRDRFAEAMIFPPARAAVAEGG